MLRGFFWQAKALRLDADLLQADSVAPPQHVVGLWDPASCAEGLLHIARSFDCVTCTILRHIQGRVFDELISSRRPRRLEEVMYRTRSWPWVLSFHCDFFASPCAFDSMRSPFPARTRRRFPIDSCASRLTPSFAAAAPSNLQSPRERVSKASAASTDVFLLSNARMVLVSSVNACAMFLRMHPVFKRCLHGILTADDTAYRLMSFLFCFSILVSAHCSAHAWSCLT